MSWWRKQKPEIAPDMPLRFKSPSDAFEYACKYLDCKPVMGSAIPALIINVVSGGDDMDEAEVQLAGTPLPPLIKTFVPKSVKIKKEDFVAFRIMAERPFPPGPFGVPEYILKPEYSIGRGGWLAERVLFKPRA
ncbi:hypothetical protein [Solimonas variicoloris]|uniref:hypothetical protein n=1 Tax=Solimonas variicoloris TaxID=254408 RepID=UPI0012B5325E|nr:hypothetical protein [Solimonas variicoloris]